PQRSTTNPAIAWPVPETTKKAVVSGPASVKLRPNCGISQGKSEGMTRWKKCEVPWAKPMRDITRKSTARVAVADASMSAQSNPRAIRSLEMGEKAGPFRSDGDV